MQIHIRAAGPADLDRLADLWIELAQFHEPLDPRFVLAPDAKERWRDFVSGIIEGEDVKGFLAEDGDQAIGFILGMLRNSPDIFQERQVGSISDMVVSHRYRRQGVGEQLCQAMIQWFKERGIRSVDVSVAADNPPGLSFWRRQGFKDWMHRMVIEI